MRHDSTGGPRPPRRVRHSWRYREGPGGGGGGGPGGGAGMFGVVRSGAHLLRRFQTGLPALPSRTLLPSLMSGSTS